MSNVSRVNGLRPVKHFNGSPYNGQANRYFVAASDATPIFIGDIVTLAATTDALGTQGVTKAPATGGVVNAAPVVGVVVGVNVAPVFSQTFFTNLNSPQYRPANTAMYLLVADDPSIIFAVQSAVAPTPTDLNGNATLTDAGGSTLTGFSGLYVSAYTNSATAVAKVMGAEQRVDNDITSANYKVLISLNNHQYSGGTGTAGV